MTIGQISDTLRKVWKYPYPNPTKYLTAGSGEACAETVADVKDTVCQLTGSFIVTPCVKYKRCVSHDSVHVGGGTCG